MEIAKDPKTRNGKPTSPVVYDRACLEEVCGSCAMRINGKARMACTALIDALDQAEPKAAAAIEKEDFTGAMAALATLRQPIDAFFDHVTVNDPDAAKRERRLNLLMRFRDAVNRVADFSKIEG